MAINLKTCFVFSICLFLFLPGSAYSEEEKSASKDKSSDKAQIEKNIKQMPGLVFPWTDEKYSMRVITPNPNIDPGILKDITKPGTEYSMNIINPYTKRKTTGYTGPCFGSFRNKFQLKGKRYETPIPGPVK